MKLSARALNNVIIFAMLVMIALFNLDQWLPQPKATPQLQLIGENDMVLRIDIGSARLERAGTQWRLIDPDKHQRSSGDALITHWLKARLQPADSVPTPNSRVVAKVWLARQSAPAEVVLYKSEDGDFVQIGEYTYTLENTTFTELVFNQD